MRVVSRPHAARSIPFLFVLLAALAATLQPGTPAGPGNAPAGTPRGRGANPPFVEGELIVKFRNSSAAAEKDKARADLGAQRRRRFRSGAEHWTLPPGLSTEKAIARQRGNPHIEYIEPNYIVRSTRAPNDPRYAELYGLNNTGQTGGTPGADISAESAWDITRGERAIVVAVIDSGIDWAHEDLAQNIFINDGEIAGNGVDDDGNGYIDDVRGWDFVHDDNDPFDDFGHGTHVAGTIGAVGDNGLGIAGVAWRVSILPLKFLDYAGYGTTAGAVAAVEYAAMMGADIANNSWGGTGFSQALLDAIEESATADMLFVAAAGNDGLDNDLFAHYPASYPTPSIVSVAATDHDDALVFFSNYGVNSVDLAAPGMDILSTLPGGYGVASGTSMAAPHVSGAASLIRALSPGVGVVELKQRLLDTVDPVPGLSGRVLTGGRLNAFLPIADPDDVAPGMVVDLATESPGGRSMGLVWSATGDDDLAGIASSYDVRYSSGPIDDLNFDAAQRSGGEPVPLPAGTVQRMRVEGLDFDTTYYFAIKARDEWGNTSPVSNMAIGTTLGPPRIRVQPASVQADLLSGQTAIRTVTIDNDGVSDLDFEIAAVLDRGAASAAPVTPAGQIAGSLQPSGEGAHALSEGRSGGRIIVEPPGDGGGGSAAAGWDEGFEPGRESLTAGEITIGNLFATGFRLLILQSGGTISEIQDLLLAFPDIAVVDQFDAQIGTPDLQTLQQYDAVLVVVNSVVQDRIAVGDVLADYADGGGGVVLTLASFVGNWQIGGRFLTDGYYPLAASGGPIGSAALLNFDAGHPIMEGVTWATGDLVAAALLQAGAEWVGDWSNGFAFAATKGPNVAAINVFVGTAGTWSGDIPLILHNAAFWSSVTVPWLTVDPVTGVVPPGGSVSIAVLFDAAGVEGGAYDATIVVSSNDPVTPEENVAAHLLVTSAPDIHLPEDDIDFGPHFIGSATDAVVTVENLGDLPLSVSGVSLVGASFSAPTAGFDLGAGEHHDLIVTFAPDVAGPLAGSLTLQSDDPDEGAVMVSLRGVGLVPPVITAAPDSLTETLFTGLTSSQLVTIRNEGGSDLFVEVGFERNQNANLAPFTTAMNVADYLATASPGTIAASGAPPGPRAESNGASILVLATAQVAGSVEKVLNERGDAYDLVFTESFAAIDLSPYDTLIVAMDGGLIQAADVQALAGAAATGKLLIMIGGTNYTPYYEGLQSFLIGHTGQIGWVRSKVPHLAVVEPLNVLSRDLPDEVTFVEPAASYYMLRIDDPEANVAVRNGDGHPALIDRRIGEGKLIYFVNTPDEYVWWNAVDYAVFRQILNNALEFRPVRWLSADKAAVVVPAGGSTELNVLFDAFGLDGGVYGANVLLNSNDPLTPSLPIPVQLQVIGAPDIDVATTSIDFGPLFIGATLERQVSVANVGTDLLTVSEVRADLSDFEPGMTGFTLDPGASLDIPVTFRPSVIGPLAATLTLVSDDVDEGVVTVALQGEGLLPPIMTATPLSLTEDLITGQASKRTLTITNMGGNDLEWSIKLHGAIGDTLEDDLESLNAGFQTITDRIPQRYDFLDGETGDRIIDGGGDMYDGGNILSTDLGALVYSNNAIVDSAAFGPLGRYFTRKFPGLFVLGADLQGAQRFTITGNLGADGQGAVDGAILEVNRHGITYRGFVKRVYGAYDPSVNHLLIVPDAPQTQHAYSTNTNDDFHEVTGLPPDGRLYDLLYAGTGGAYIDDAATLEIMTALIERLEPAWLRVSPRDGTVTPGAGVDIDVEIDATGLSGAPYHADIEISGNDPLTPRITVPVDLLVTGAPDIELSTNALDFGAVFIGAARELGVTVSNTGVEPLVVSDVSIDLAEFTAATAGFTLMPGDDREIVVRFDPDTAGPLAGSMTLTSSDPDEGVTIVALMGEGVPPPVIDVQPDSLTELVREGGTVSRTLTVSNTGLSELNFEIRALRSSSPGQQPAFGTGFQSDSGAGPGSLESEAPPGGYQAVVSEEIVSLDATALLIQDVAPWNTASNEQILDANMIVFDRINSTTLAGTDLTRYRLVIVASDQPTAFYIRVAAQEQQVNDYVEQGGVLEYHAAGWGYSGGDAARVTLPGGMGTVHYATYTNPVLLPAHPLMRDVTDPMTGSSASHAYFTNVPVDAARIAGTTTGQPTLVEYPFGHGWVVAGAQTFEFGYAHGQETGIVLRNMIPYTAGFAPPWLTLIPETGQVPAGDLLEVTVEIDVTGLPPDIYHANLFVTSNDPVRPEIDIPVTVDVYPDSDGDGVGDPFDNCPDRINPQQEDGDGDGVGDLCDNCPSLDNGDQADADIDGVGDLCDNCPAEADPTQADTDLDGVGDVCDNCPDAANADQADREGDGDGDACQPSLALEGIEQDGGELLEVRALASDPQGDALSGSIAILGERIETITLPEAFLTGDCDLGFLPDGVPGEGIGFHYRFRGSILFDLDSLIGCNDGQPDFVIGLGTCDQPGVPFSTRRTLPLAAPFSICVRRMGMVEGGIDLDVSGYDTVALHASTLQQTKILEIPFTDGLPRRSPLHDMVAGELHRLTISLTDGSTLPVGAEAGFLYQGESAMIVNHPPQAVIHAPAVAECDRPAGREIVLDGSASIDPNSSANSNDDIVSFEWLEDPGGPGERILGTSAVHPTVMSIGDHLVGLRVIDSEGEFDLAMASLTVQDTQPPDLVCAPAAGECSSPAGAAIAYAAIVSDLCSSTIAVANDRTAGGADASDIYPLGTTPVAFAATDEQGNVGHCATTMTVRDTIRPTLTVSPQAPLLWPPNHRMVTVPIGWQANDACDANPTVVLESVSSSEPDDADGDGDGSTTGDMTGVDTGSPDTELLLRAERAGGGPGRLYNLIYSVTDASQNSAQGLAVVSVPHDLGAGPEPLQMRLEPDGLPGMASLYWPALPGSVGYDIVAAALADASVVDGRLDLASAQVLGRGVTQSSLHEDASGPVPPLGQAIIYVIQQRTNDGGTGYGTATAPWPRLPSACAGGCP